MIFWAVAGPTPGSASSCSRRGRVQVDGRGGGARAGRPRRACTTRRVRRGATGGRDSATGVPAARRHDHLLAVEQLGGQVDGLQFGLGAGAAGRGEQVGDARAGRQMVDAGSPDRAADVDHDLLRTGVRAGRRTSPTATEHRTPARAETAPAAPRRGTRREQVARAEHGDDEGQGDVDVRLAARVSMAGLRGEPAKRCPGR